MLLILMLTSKGMAGVPRASLVVIAATLNQFNIPEAGLLLILGVDTFLDMGRSATNAVGNSIATAVVAKWEGELLPEAEAEANARTLDAERRDARASGARLRRGHERSRDCDAALAARCWLALLRWRGVRASRSAERRAGRADRHAGQGARRGHDHDRLPRVVDPVFVPVARAASRSAIRSSCASRSSTRSARRSAATLAIKWVPVTSESRIDAVAIGPGRPRVRLDHQQPRAPEAVGFLADRSSSPAPS